MSMSFECEDCGKVSSSAAAILYCDCGEIDRPKYTPKRWRDYDYED